MAVLAKAAGRACGALGVPFRGAWAWIGAQPYGKVVLGGVFAVLAAGGLALWGMERFLCDRPEYRISLTSVSWDPVPEWASAGALEALNSAVTDGGRETTASMFDRGLVGRVGSRLEKVPYLRKLEAVRKSAPGGLSIRIEWRVPFLYVQSGGGILLDRDGLVMPREGILPGRLSVPTLTGLRYAGAAFPGVQDHRPLAGVFEALALYEKEGFSDTYPRARIRSAHLANDPERRQGRPELTLRTEGGVSIHLSIQPGSGRPLLTEQIAALRELFDRDPALTDVREYVDVRFAEPVYR